MMETKAGLLHSVRDSHGLEVATMVNCTSLSVDEGVIRCYIHVYQWNLDEVQRKRHTRIAFDGEGFQGMKDVFNLRANELRGCAKRISVLS